MRLWNIVTPLGHYMKGGLGGLGYCLLILTAIVVAQVVFRYVLKIPLLYASELAMLIFAWVSFTGMILAMIDRDHLTIDVLTARVTPKVRLIFLIIDRILILIFSAAVFYYSIAWVKNSLGAKMPVSGIYYFYSYGIVSLSFLVMAAVAGEQIVDSFKKLSKLHRG